MSDSLGSFMFDFYDNQDAEFDLMFNELFFVPLNLELPPPPKKTPKMHSKDRMLLHDYCRALVSLSARQYISPTMLNEISKITNTPLKEVSAVYRGFYYRQQKKIRSKQ